MKKTLAIFLLSSLISSVCVSQGVSNLTQQIPLEYDQKIIDIYSINPLTAYCCGTNGLIVKTINGGETWNSMETNTIDTLKSILFSNDSVGFCISSTSTILYTTDYGETWTPFETGLSETLNKIDFFNDSIGCCVGTNGLVLWTNDQGESWIQQNTPTNDDLYDVCVINKETAIAIGTDRTIIKTTDSGENWTSVSITSYCTNLVGIDFCSNNNGVIIGEIGYAVRYLYTEDCGETWSEYGFPWLADDVHNIQFIDSTHGFVSTSHEYYPPPEKKAFAITSDKGETWQLIDDDIVCSHISMADTMTGFGINKYSYHVYKTENGGSSFQTNYSLQPPNLYAVDFLDSINGCCVGSGGEIIITNNAGENWQIIPRPTHTDFKSIVCINEDIWIGVGDYGYIMKSSDLGHTWTQKNSNTSEHLNTIFYSTPNTIMTIGDNGTILRSIDYGETWQDVSVSQSIWLTEGKFVNDSTAFILGNTDQFPYCRYFYKTTDSGNTWTTIEECDIKPNCSFFISTTDGFIGRGNLLYKTTDGYNNWEIIYQCDNPTFIDINYINFYDENFGFLSGVYTDGNEHAGTTWDVTNVYYTTDGGYTWEFLFSKSINKISYTDNNTGFMVGNNGLIYKFDFTTNSILESINEEKSIIFPNPSDGNFTIGLDNNSEIEIYNHSGQIVRKMELEKGGNSIDLSYLPSGIYIIKVKSNDTFQIHKLLITK